MATGIERGSPFAFLASAARTADVTSQQFHVGQARGLIVIIDVTAIAATPSVVFNVRGFDPISGKSYLLLASAAIVAVSTVVLRIHPELTAAANLIAKDLCPNIVEVFADHIDADSITYSVTGMTTL